MVVYSIYFLYVISKDNISFLFIHKGDIGEQGEQGVLRFYLSSDLKVYKGQKVILIV